MDLDIMVSLNRDSESASYETKKANCQTANQKARKFYNGHTTDEIQNSDVIGLHSMDR